MVRKSSRCLVSLVSLVLAVGAAAFGCGANGNTPALTVGGEGPGGGPGGGGAGTLDLGDAGHPRNLAAHIEQNQVAVTIVTLGCSGDCADVEAVATGGFAPYSFAWEDGSTSAARHVCPTSTTAYRVAVTDTGATSGEFPRPPETVTAPLTAEVLTCSDGGTTGTDGGMALCADASTPAPEPPGRYVGTIDCPASTSSGGASGVTGAVTLDFAADGTGTLFFQWSLVVLGAQGTVHAPACSDGNVRSKWDGSWGVPGLPDPNNPNNPPGLIPTGPVTGALTMTPGTPRTISGKFNWYAPPVANAAASICVGSFTATLKP